MKAFYRTILLAATAIMVCGCPENPEPTPTPTPEPEAKLSVSPTSLSFGNTASEQTITITSTKDWKATVDGDGFSLSSSAGAGNAEVKVSAKANESTDSRSGKITITSGDKTATVDLSQKGEDVVISVDGNSVEVPVEGGTFEIDVKYNTDYKVEVEESAQEWLHYIGTKTIKNGKIEFKADANEAVDERSGKVTVSGKNASDPTHTITFTQKGEDVVITVEGDSVEVPAEGGTFEVAIKYNTDYQVDIEESAQAWIHLVETKTVKDGTLTFSVDANEAVDERSGKVTVSGKNASDPTHTITFTQAAFNFDKLALEKLYKAMDGDNWRNPAGWLMDDNINNWRGVTTDEKGRVRKLDLAGFGLKGSIPDCIGDLDNLKILSFNDNGIIGKVPEAIGKLSQLEQLTINYTSVEGPLPDVFGNMKSLKNVSISCNFKLGGALPPSLGDCPELESIDMSYNAFTGSIPEEWCKYDKLINVYCNNLSGQFPAQFYEMPSAQRNLWEFEDRVQNDCEIDMGNAAKIPGDYPSYKLTQYDGTTFTYDEVIRKSKYTVEFFWASWRPEALALIDQLKEMYDQYHKDGLEIIAFAPLDARDGDTEASDARLRKFNHAKGYDQWYNILPSSATSMIAYAAIPLARVYDSDGNVIFSFEEYPDSGQNRFSYRPKTDLIPFLEKKFGPIGKYESTDYSKDGEVFTIQEASTGKGINIVLMGDGYSDRAMGVDGEYETLMRDATEEFFAIEPFKSFRDRFNVYGVKVVSKNGHVGKGYSTALETVRGSDDGASETTDGNNDKATEYALKVPGISTDDLVVIVMCNDFSVGGSTSWLKTANDHYYSQCWLTSQGGIGTLFGQGFGSTLRHEVGHGFGLLADEYYSAYTERPTAKDIENAQNRYDRYGFGANIDFTGDNTKARWAHMLADPRYKGIVGLYEGGEGYVYGKWRPTPTSIMRVAGIDRFNAPSREAIYKRLMLLSGEYNSLSDYKFEDFASYDAINREGDSILMKEDH